MYLLSALSHQHTEVQRELISKIAPDHGVEGSGRATCCVIQHKSGLSPLKRHATASTSTGRVGRPQMRQVCLSDKTRSTTTAAQRSVVSHRIWLNSLL